MIEEVQDVGRSELRACGSLLRQAMVRLLKLHAWPGSPAAAHWRGEVADFLADARCAFAPSMRQRIDLAELYADALYQVRTGTDDADELHPLSEVCPFALDELLAKRRDVTALAAKLSFTVETERR